MKKKCIVFRYSNSSIGVNYGEDLKPVAVHISSSGSKLRLVDELKPPQQDLPTPLKTMEAVEFDHINLISFDLKNLMPNLE